MEWFKEHFKALGAALLIVAIMLASFVPALAPYQEGMLTLAASLGVGGTALLAPFMVKKKEE